MTALRIYDLNQRVLAFDLIDLLQLLAPRSLEAEWIVSTVKSSTSGEEWFEATGEGADRLEILAQTNTRLSGSGLAALAGTARQIIWGEFVGLAQAQSDKPWVIIRAVDSTFYEVDTDDEIVLRKISSTYKDVRLVEASVTSWLQTGL